MLSQEARRKFHRGNWQSYDMGDRGCDMRMGQSHSIIPAIAVLSFAMEADHTDRNLLAMQL
jgi:hypothetical protein